MGAPGLEVDLEERGEAVRLERLVVGDAVPAVGHHRELVVGPRVAPDRGVDGAGRAGRGGPARVRGRPCRPCGGGRRSSAPSRRARPCRSPSPPTYRRRGAARSPAARTRRWWRSGSPAAARWPTTVGPVQPGDGCTAIPTGLSSTTIESSSWMIRMPSTSSGSTARAGSAAAGMVTSSIAPACTRSLLTAPRAVDLDETVGDQRRRAGAREAEHPGHRRVDAAPRPVRRGHRCTDAPFTCLQVSSQFARSRTVARGGGRRAPVDDRCGRRIRCRARSAR